MKPATPTTSPSPNLFIINTDHPDELAAQATARGFRPTVIADIPSVTDIAQARNVVLPSERFNDLPRARLSEHDVRIWIADGLNPWQRPLPLWGTIIKRVIDIAVACVFLFVIAPLLAAVAVAIKVGSRGPILHVQTRLGVDGRWFEMRKFRTMKTDNDATRHAEHFEQFAKGEVDRVDGIYKIVDDPRVTRMGRFLRKYSIDEVPQFLNVLRGHMSVVGPRPMLPREITSLDGSGWQRLRVKPGITGLWQVSGRSRTTFETMIELDVAYWKSWSLRQELTILLRTPAALLRAETA